MNATIQELEKKDLLSEKAYYAIVRFDDITKIKRLFMDGSVLKKKNEANQLSFNKTALNFFKNKGNIMNKNTVRFALR